MRVLSLVCVCACAFKCICVCICDVNVCVRAAPIENYRISQYFVRYEPYLFHVDAAILSMRQRTALAHWHAGMSCGHARYVLVVFFYRIACFF